MGERPVPRVVEGCESGGEDSADVIQRRGGMEVGATKKINTEYEHGKRRCVDVQPT